MISITEQVTNELTLAWVTADLRVSKLADAASLRQAGYSSNPDLSALKTALAALVAVGTPFATTSTMPEAIRAVRVAGAQLGLL